MSFIGIKLSQLETRLRALIEGSTSRLFPNKDLQNSLVERLTASMQAGARSQPNGETIVPNLYIISVPSNIAKELNGGADLQEQLAHTLQSSADQTGYRFYSPPVVRIVEDTQVLPNQINVTGRISIEDLAQTSDLVVQQPARSSVAPERAFLIVNGTQIFPLMTPVVNIGRRSDNDLVISDARVSRVHAQLRVVHGYFMIFDLDSTGGTFINDQPVQQSILYPGDVISLGGIPLVYGEEEITLSQTQQI